MARRLACGSPCLGWARRAGRFLGALGLLAALVLTPNSGSSSAEPSQATEYQLKAAFLFNFIKFTEWPADELEKNEDFFVIGVLGKDPFGAALDKVVEGETIHDKKIVVRRFADIDQAAHSQILFIGSSEQGNLPEILRLLDGRSVLTVSEIQNFAQRGGVIHLKTENNRVTFEINLEAAKRARLMMSAQLLKLAKIVKGKA